MEMTVEKKVAEKLWDMKVSRTWLTSTKIQEAMAELGINHTIDGDLVAKELDKIDPDITIEVHFESGKIENTIVSNSTLQWQFEGNSKRYANSVFPLGRIKEVRLI
jgi:hypothetical protein